MNWDTPEDDYNCGIGVVAAIRIMLCNAIGVKQDDDFKFVTIFSKKTLIVSFCKKTEEYVWSFPEDTFQTLPPLMRCQFLERLTLLF
jgi:hypothetical protein